MKNLFFKTRFLFLSFLILSCSKDNPNDQQTVDVNYDHNIHQRLSNVGIEEIFNKIVELDDTNEQILAASTLAAEDKLSLWQYKLNNFKSKNDLHEIQITYIDELLSKLKVEYFIEGSNERKEFLENMSKIYMLKAKSLFGENEGWYLLTKVENINNRIDKLNLNSEIPVDENLARGIKTCTCVSDSECVRLTGASVWGLSWEYGTCGGSACYVQTYFFGLWESDNNGRCIYN
ncbi:bacteriocin fulvocin C-related protein [Flavobacterium sp.]